MITDIAKEKLNKACIACKDAQLGSNIQAIQNAMNGDLVFVLTPATLTTLHKSTAWTRTVEVALKDSKGNYHDWFSGDVTVSIADTSSAGTATIPSTTLSLVNGKANIVISGGATAWLATETDTLTVAQKTIFGATVLAKTSVETFN